MNKEISIKPLGKRSSLWGEGPIWWKDHLYYVDIEGKALIELEPYEEKERVWHFNQRIGCLSPTNSDDFLCAGDNGIFLFNPKNNQTKKIADPEKMMPENRFNDGKCDTEGRFWAGTISLKKIRGTASLYCLGNDRSIEKKISSLTNSNGIAWSKNNKKFFHIDTPTKTIKSYIFNSSNASITLEKTLVDTQALGFDSSPDGMTIDDQDRLWVAFCHGSCVASFDSISGTLLCKIILPVSEVTSCTFGGKKMDRLFVTSGINKNIEEINAGRIFVIDGLLAKGTVTNIYKI